MKYFQFELKKIFNNKKNRILFIILSILIIILVLFSINLKSSNNLESLETTLNENITYTDQTLKSFKSDEGIPADLITDAQKTLNLYTKQSKALKNNNLTEYNKLQIEINNLSLKNGQNKKYIDEQNSYIRNVINKGLSFENSPRAQLRSFGIINEILFPLIFSSLFYLIIALLGGVSVSTEFENEGIKLYKTPLFNDKNIIFYHFASNVFTLSLCYIIALSFYIVGVGFFNGFGAINYPSGIPSIPLVENGIVDILYLIWGFLVIMFIVSFGILLSVFLRKSLLVIGVFSIIFLGYDLLKNQEFMTSLLKYLPMSYFNPIDILTKDYLSSKYGLIIGVFYISALIIVFLLISIRKYRTLSFRKI